MTNGAPKTADEWKKEKETAEAETAALDAQKKLIEAKTALESAQSAADQQDAHKEKDAADKAAAALDARRKVIEGKTALANAEAAAARQSAQRETQDKLESVKASREIADANKAAAEARKAASEADLTAFKAAVGEVPQSGYTGDVTLKPDAGKIEAALLAARAVRLAARKIQEAIVKAQPNPKSVLLYAAGELPKLDAWISFAVQTELVRGAFKEAERKRMPKATEGRAKLEAVVAGVPIAAAAGLTLDAVNKLLGYFRTDYTTGGVDVTLDDSLLVNAVAGALNSANWEVLIPARYDSGLETAAKAVLATLTELTQLNADAKDEQQQRTEKAAELAKKAAAETDKTSKKALEAEAKQNTDAAAAWKAPITLYEGLYQKLTTPNDKGIVPLDAVVRERRLMEKVESGSHVLTVKLHSSGGAFYTQKNLWTLFGGMPLYHMGGTVAAFALFNGASGAVLVADVVPVHGGFVKARDLHATLNP